MRDGRQILSSSSSTSTFYRFRHPELLGGANHFVAAEIGVAAGGSEAEVSKTLNRPVFGGFASQTNGGETSLAGDDIPSSSSDLRGCSDEPS